MNHGADLAVIENPDCPVFQSNFLSGIFSTGHSYQRSKRDGSN